MADLTEEQKKAYASHLIQQAAHDVDYLGIFEQFPEWSGAPEDETNDLSDSDGRAIDRLIRRSVVTVTFLEPDDGN